MENIIIIAIVLAVVISVSIYLYRAKKSGQHCIGCPNSKNCCGKCGNSSNEKK
ncbi:MAG: FeoB-associated Cys-rich membrane protein [Ruminococcus sp.]|nr:FeoB-associated Cys-rich membrane protein [Ruminococcus sp.]